MLKNYFAAPQPQYVQKKAPLYDQFTASRVKFADLSPPRPQYKLPDTIVIDESESSSSDERRQLEQQKIYLEIYRSRATVDYNTAQIKSLAADVADLERHILDLQQENDVLRHDKYHVDLLRLQRDYNEREFVKLMRDHSSGKIQKLMVENKKLKLLAQKLLSSYRSSHQ